MTIFAGDTRMLLSFSRANSSTTSAGIATMRAHSSTHPIW